LRSLSQARHPTPLDTFFLGPSFFSRSFSLSMRITFPAVGGIFPSSSQMPRTSWYLPFSPPRSRVSWVSSPQHSFVARRNPSPLFPRTNELSTLLHPPSCCELYGPPSLGHFFPRRFSVSSSPLLTTSFASPHRRVVFLFAELRLRSSGW